MGAYLSRQNHGIDLIKSVLQPNALGVEAALREPALLRVSRIRLAKAAGQKTRKSTGLGFRCEDRFVPVLRPEGQVQAPIRGEIQFYYRSLTDCADLLLFTGLRTKWRTQHDPGHLRAGVNADHT